MVSTAHNPVPCHAVAAPLTRGAKARAEQAQAQAATVPVNTPPAPAAETNATPEVAAPEPVQDAGPRVLRPGFPQADIPDRTTHQNFVRENANRRRHDEETSRQLAMEARTRESENLAHVVAPVTVCYNIKDLQKSNRLLDGFKLDLSPGSRTPSVDKHEIARLAADILRKETQATRVPKAPATAPANPKPVEPAPSATRDKVPAPAPTPSSPSSSSGSDDSTPPQSVRVLSGVQAELPAEIRDPWIKQKGNLLHPASNPRSESPSREVPKADKAKAKPKAPAKGGEGPRAYGLSGVGKATVLAAAVAAISSLPGANAQPDDLVPSTSFESPHGLGFAVSTFAVFFAMWVVFAMAITYRPKGVLSKCLRAFVCTGTSC
jgi:hypothetical protein